MKNFILISLTTIALAMALAACKFSPKEQLVETYKFRRNAVFCQTNNLIDDIAQTYTDRKAVMRDLDMFIRQNSRVEKVTLASTPMGIHPFSISFIEVQKAAPKPIGKYIDRKRFNRSEDMVWYRKLLRKKVAYWYQSGKNSEMVSYIYPVLKELNPAVVLYVLKLDFNKRDNPILFWNVPKKYYAQELLKQEKEYLKKYFRLKKEAEQKVLTAEQLKKFREAKSYYDLRFREVKEIGEQREKEFKQLEKQENR
jgi:hypothetical protein